jgi:hypothetical protein
MPWTNPYFDRMIYGPSDFDHKHRIVTSCVWDIPVGNHMKGAGRKVLGGWQLTGVQQFQTGSPMTVVSGKDLSLTSLGRDRAISTGADPSRPAGFDPILQWFNRAAFAPNPTETFGTLGKGTLRGPGMFSWDKGAFKRIPLRGDNVNLQFRAEFFNVFNHPMFNNPSSNLSDGNYGKITQTLATGGYHLRRATHHSARSEADVLRHHLVKLVLAPLTARTDCGTFHPKCGFSRGTG